MNELEPQRVEFWIGSIGSWLSLLIVRLVTHKLKGLRHRAEI